MRSAVVVAVILGCGSGSAKPEAVAQTSGPIGSIVKTGKDAVKLEAVRHQVPLADTPIAAWIGLPVVGTVEIDADLTVPVVSRARDYRAATGTIGLRCVGRCTIGDDKTKFKPEVGDRVAGFVGDGIDFSHLDFDKLEATVAVVAGRARLSHWVLESPDVSIKVDATVELASELGRSMVTACVRYRPTEGLKQRDAKLYALFALVGGALGPDGDYHIKVEGAVGQLKATGRACDDTP